MFPDTWECVWHSTLGVESKPNNISENPLADCQWCLDYTFIKENVLLLGLQRPTSTTIV